MSESLRSARVRVAVFSVFASAAILALKWYAFWITGSAALKSDALESVVNVLAAAFALGAIVFAAQPADREHPYGHGKIEHFSAAFEGGLISLAAILIMYDGVRALLEGREPRNLDVGLIVNFVAGAMNGLLGLYLVRAGRRHRSEAIEAGGHHVMSDFLTTLGIAAGLLVMRFTGLAWLDAAIAFAIGGALALMGYRLVRKSSEGLLDAQDPGTIERFVRALNAARTDDVIAVHALRTMGSGRYTHADLHVVVPEFFEVRRAHETVDRFCERVIAEVGIEGEFHTHVDPCARAYCRECVVGPCAIRREAFVARKDLALLEAIRPDLNPLG